MAEFETRTVTAQVEFRDDPAAPTIVGHAATFNQPYPVGLFTERIHRDAFNRTLSGSPDVRLLVDHEGQPLARTKSGTLTLGTDDTGLTVRAALDPTDPDVQRLVPKMRRGDMDQMSFAFRVPVGGDLWDHSGETPLRTIREANLSGGDVSIVTYPANENAAVHLRSEDLRDAHFTLAVALIGELREGRAIDTDRLKRVLDALQGADTALDGSLAAISDMLGVENSDVDQDENADPMGIREKLLAPDEIRAMSTGDVNDLPDSDFAYIEPGGTKDSEGKTTPRSLRHFPIHDAAHVRNALARLSDSPFGDKAKSAVAAAAKKFGVEVSYQNSTLPVALALRLAEAQALRRTA